jgi:hypothetical protein
LGHHDSQRVPGLDLRIVLRSLVEEAQPMFGIRILRNEFPQLHLD